MIYILILILILFIVNLFYDLGNRTNGLHTKSLKVSLVCYYDILKNAQHIVVFFGMFALWTLLIQKHLVDLFI